MLKVFIPSGFSMFNYIYTHKTEDFEAMFIIKDKICSLNFSNTSDSNLDQLDLHCHPAIPPLSEI